MRLVNFERDGRLTWGAVVDETVVELAGQEGLTAYDSVDALLAAGPEALATAEARAADPPSSSSTSPLGDVRLRAPVLRPGKVMAIGLNYWDHCEEQDVEPPDRPLVFAKFPTAVIGPDETIRWDPALTSKVDWEAELAVVIGRPARHVGKEDALDHVAGYMASNDVSARDLQFGDKQWVRGKSLDTFCPLGPWLATPETVGDHHGLRISSRVNGHTMQQSSTDKMIFDVPSLIAFLSDAFTLEPGDVILTGTPAGVGVFRDPSVYLQDGDVVEVEIQDLGVLRNPCATNGD